MTEDETRPDPALVDVVARAMRLHHLIATLDPAGQRLCACGRRSEGDDWDEHMAEVALTALSATGRLLPDGGETRVEAEVRYQTNNGALKDRVYYDGWTPERREREFAAAIRLGAEVISERTRTVTTWPDGSTYTSAWTEIRDDT